MKTYGMSREFSMLQRPEACSVFAVGSVIGCFENTEGFAGDIWTLSLLQVEGTAKVIMGKAMPIPNYRCLAPRFFFNVISEPDVALL